MTPVAVTWFASRGLYVNGQRLWDRAVCKHARRILFGRAVARSAAALYLLRYSRTKGALRLTVTQAYLDDSCFVVALYRARKRISRTVHREALQNMHLPTAPGTYYLTPA